MKERLEVDMGSVDNQMFEDALKSLREENKKLRKHVSNLEKMIEDLINTYNKKVK
jgi:phosphate uptake regulator